MVIIGLDQPGKNVFKKSVKLMVSVVPTQHAHTVAVDPSHHGSDDAGETIVFDGKTFTVTFTQISGD